MADSDEFKQAAIDVRNLAVSPPTEEYAKLYSLYKQATAGDCNTERPADDERLTQAKYDAWMARKGASRDDAAREYITAAVEAKAKYGVKQ